MNTIAKKVPFVFLLIVLFTVAIGFGSAHAESIEDIKTIKFQLENGEKSLAIFDINSSEYFKLDEYSKMLGLYYKVNKDDSVYIGNEDSYISGVLNDPNEKCKIKKDGVKTEHSFYSSPFYFDGKTIYIKSDMAVTVFTDNSYVSGMESYNVVNPVGVQWNYNGNQISFEDYILVGNMIYVDVDSFTSKYGAQNVQFKVSGDKMRITNSKAGYEYIVSLNSPNIVIKNFGEIHSFDNPLGASTLVKVGNKYYLDSAFAMVGNYFMDDMLTIEFYNGETYEAIVREKYKLNNLLDLINTLAGMNDYDSSSLVKIDMMDGDPEYKSAGTLSLDYSRNDSKIFLNILSDDQDNSDSPFSRTKMNKTAIFDVEKGSVYEKSENGFWHKITGRNDADMRTVLSAVNDNLLNQYIMMVGRNSYGDRVGFKEDNEKYLNMISLLFNDDILVKDGKGYRYQLDISKLVKILEPLSESSYSARQFLEEMDSGEISMDINVDIKIDVKNEKINSIDGKIIFELEEYDKKGINISFKSIIKSPSEFEMPKQEYILE